MGFRLQVENELWMESGACDEARLRALFLECDVDGSGVIEKGEFERMCSGLCVRSADIDDLFRKLDANQDGAINMEEFIRGFQTASSLSRGEEPSGAEDFTLAWEDFKNRLGEHSRFIPRIDQVSTLYHNIGLTESRMIPQYEKVLLNFTKEVKLQSKEMERLALAVKRAQDQAAIQLSAMEEEMDQRIQAAERNTRVEESKKAEAALSIVKDQYEAQLSELHQKVLTLQMVEDMNKSTSLKEENVILKRKNNELTLQNQKLKQELLESQTSIAILQSELDSAKSDLTDQSINLERDEALMRSFSEGRENLERQIEILQLANRKLHDTNDGLRMTLENSQSKNKIQRVSGLSPASTIDRTKGTSTPYFERCCKTYTDDEYDQLRIAECLQTQSSDSYALALCDPMRRRSSCEVDSLYESYIDSGLSTLRSNNGYNSEQGSTGRSTPNTAAFSCSGDTSDTEVPEVQDEPRYESDSESVMNMTLNSLDVKDITAPGKKSLSPIFSEKLKNETVVTAHASAKTYKIVLAGDAAVGKSSFLLRLCKNEFKGITSTTLGVDFQMKTLVVDGVPTVLQLWDTAGQERFKSIAKSYFRRADGVLLLYDVTCERSFLNVREWVDTIEDVSQYKIPIMLVGNKTDLRQEALKNDVTCISTSLGEKLGRTYSSLFCETSAKDGSNIIEAVLHLAREVIKHAQERKHATLGPNLSGSPSSKISSSVCCRP